MLEQIIEQPLLLGFASAILQPRLRSILIFDMPAAELDRVAKQLAKMIAATTQENVCVTPLAGFEHDDHLWGDVYIPQTGSEQGEHAARALIFSKQKSSNNQQIITIPHLSRINQAVARACLMQVGANVVHLERSGQQDYWQPQQYWLASCSSQEVGMISPHLLDRFVLRLRWQDAGEGLMLSREERMHALLATQNYPAHEDAFVETEEIVRQIRQAEAQRVALTEEAVEQIMDYQAEDMLFPRREVALMEMAVAMAKLAGDGAVQVEHVMQAASNMGLQSMAESEVPQGDEEWEPDEESEMPAEQVERATQSGVTGNSMDTLTQKIKETREVQKPEASVLSSVEGVVAPSNPYPEDTVAVEREYASLKLPYRNFTMVRTDHGPVVGIEARPDLRDLAIVSTVLAATKRRLIRDQHKFEEPRTQNNFEVSDLHCYRRGQPPASMLLLLLDYTSMYTKDWQTLLLPYLQHAYTQRASITLIQVGVKGADHPLQAQVVSARSILVPRIDAALEAERGKGTPLAHGFELALHTIQRVLQHGRSTARHVNFVVLSDGRGNIPLQASKEQRINFIVTDEGINDTLAIAQQIRGIKHVYSTVLDLEPEYYPQLPQQLAQALGAYFQEAEIAQLEVVEVSA